MPTNVITANFNGAWSCVTAPLWQWDFGQILEITGIDNLPATFEVHFANFSVGSSVSSIATDGRVTIPNQLLTSGNPVYAWIYLSAGETDGETEYKITIPVNRRAMPSDETPTPQDRSAIAQAIAALNTAAQDAAETVASEIVDPTLEVSGKAADAAKTGEELSNLKSDLNEITEVSSNLLKFLNTTKTVNDVTITTDADNNVSFNGTASSNGGRLNSFTDDFTLKAGTYTIGQIVTDKATESALTRCAVSLQKRASGSNVIATVSSPNVPVTFTLDSDTTCYVGFNLTNAYVYNNVKMAVMLNAGTTLKEYESPLKSAIDRQYRATESAKIVPYTRADFVYGWLSSSGEYQLAWIYALLNGYVPTEYMSAVIGESFKVLVARYQNGAFVDIHDGAWKTGTYTFDHEAYQYKIIIAFSDQRRIGDLQDVADGLAFVQNTYAVTSSAYTMTDSINENSRTDLFNYGRLKTLMRNNYDVSFANAKEAMYWKNVYGNSQNMHPKVLYIPDGVGGHKYWIAYTPYDFGNVKHENPCIAYSDDGYNWTDISANPLANTDGEADTIYYSDTHLVYTGSRLECWYRKVNGNTETIYRRNSPNGINWTDPEEIYSVTINGNALLSPVIFYDNPTHKYRIWVVNSANGYHIDYYEAPSDDIATWSFVRSITLAYNYKGTAYNVWHIDVSLIDNKYVLIAMCKGTPWCVFMATSDDNITYTTPEILLYPNNVDDWDAEMYRSCIVKTDADYRVYYSARWRLIYGTGVTTSDSLAKFIGTV